MWELAGTVGLARAQGTEPAFPEWDYQPYFSCPSEWFGRDLIGTTVATSLVPHIDEQARSYLQDYNLFKDIEEEIRIIFEPSQLAHDILDEKVIELAELPRPIVAIHIRRGDNVQANDPGTPNKHLYHPLRPIGYYENALAQAKEEGAGSVAIFSDDIKWCQSNLVADLYFEGGKPRKKEHEEGYKTEPFSDWIDLFAMSACDKMIIGNSTFAWWAAFLSKDKSPIYPEHWFGPNLDFIDSSLMFPPFWRQFSCPIQGQLF